VVLLKEEGPDVMLKLFDGESDTPELIWDSSMRAELRNVLAEQLDACLEKRKEDGDDRFTLPSDVYVKYKKLEDELYIGGVYVSRFLKEPSYNLRDPTTFLEMVLQRWTHELQSYFTTDIHEEEKKATSNALVDASQDILQLVTSACVYLCKVRESLCDKLAQWGYMARSLTFLDGILDRELYGSPLLSVMRLLHVAANRMVNIESIAVSGRSDGRQSIVDLTMKAMGSDSLHPDSAFMVEMLKKVYKQALGDVKNARKPISMQHKGPQNQNTIYAMAPSPAPGEDPVRRDTSFSDDFLAFVAYAMAPSPAPGEGPIQRGKVSLGDDPLAMMFGGGAPEPPMGTGMPSQQPQIAMGVGGGFGQQQASGPGPQSYSQRSTGIYPPVPSQPQQVGPPFLHQSGQQASPAVPPFNHQPQISQGTQQQPSMQQPSMQQPVYGRSTPTYEQQQGVMPPGGALQSSFVSQGTGVSSLSGSGFLHVQGYGRPQTPQSLASAPQPAQQNAYPRQQGTNPSGYNAQMKQTVMQQNTPQQQQMYQQPQQQQQYQQQMHQTQQPQFPRQQQQLQQPQFQEQQPMAQSQYEPQQHQPTQYQSHHQQQPQQNQQQLQSQQAQQQQQTQFQPQQTQYQAQQPQQHQSQYNQLQQQPQYNQQQPQFNRMQQQNGMQQQSFMQAQSQQIPFGTQQLPQQASQVQVETVSEGPEDAPSQPMMMPSEPMPNPQYRPTPVAGGGVDARTKPDPKVEAEQKAVSSAGAPGSANGRIALLQAALVNELPKFLLEGVLENPTLSKVKDPAATKVHTVELLKLLTMDPGYGMKFQLILDEMPAWKNYKSQDHSLFITGTEQKADYFLTDGNSGEPTKFLTQG
jgi:hypothetical protein